MKALKKIMSLLLIFVLWGMNAFAECPKFDQDTYPRVDGSTATLPLSYALYSASTGANGETAQQMIKHYRTTQSFYDLIYDFADLLLVYEPAAEVFDLVTIEAEDGEKVPIQMKPIGRDALVFLLNANNPVDSLTQEQLVDIYTGSVTNWKDVGGEDRGIIAYQRNASSGSQVMMEALCMRGTPMAEPVTELQVQEMAGLIRAVASYRNTADAIGYSVYYYAQNMYRAEDVKLAQVDGVTPDNENIASGSYPYTQDFYAVIRADEPEDSPARQLYDWLTTDEGRELITEAGYVPAE